MGDKRRALVESLRADPAHTAILLDFDGTLAPIVDDPALAVPLPGITDALTALHEAYGLVAVVSGRPVDYLRAHLPAGPTLVGLYGLEELRDGAVETHPDAAPWRAVIDDLAEAAGAELPPAVGVEHKGLSLTLHLRRHADLAELVDDWASLAAERTGLLLRRARMSAELHPPVATDKGTVVRGLVAGHHVACFIGDDVGDLPAFDALDGFVAAGGAGVRFVVESSELDAGLRARADLLLAGPEAVLELLLALAL
ncbi:MAG: trehalose-phosphatase [Acidimicrobiales bacterium]